MKNIGQSDSISNNACMILFVGGPYNGEQGLFDSDKADSICFSNFEEKTSYSYVPAGPKRYKFDRALYWGDEK